MNTDAPPAVAFDDVTRRFDDITGVEQMTWSLAPGQVLGVLGHNGAGKTTTLRLINGVLGATSGAVRVFGMDPVREGPHVRRRTGMLLSRPGVDLRMTGRENLRFTARLYGLDSADAATRIDELTTSMHLDDRLDEPVEHYSDGMRQRLALARMLLSDPALLLFDEPTATLDPMAAHGVRQLVRDIAFARTRTVVLATSDLLEASQLSDQIVVLERGRVVDVGSPEMIAGKIGARGVLLHIDDVDRVPVSEVAIGLGYTVEPLHAGVLRIHGVGYDDVPGLVRALVDADVGVYGLRVDQPRLTDFYLALHREEPRVSPRAERRPL